MLFCAVEDLEEKVLKSEVDTRRRECRGIRTFYIVGEDAAWTTKAAFRTVERANCFSFYISHIDDSID